MSNNIEIVLVRNDKELDVCAELMQRCEPFVTLQIGIQRCMQAVRGDVKEVYAAYEDGMFTGFVVLQFAGVLRGYIQTICMEPASRNKGIGTRLLQFAEERFRGESPNVFICVSSFNHGAQKLYYQLGYEKIGELKDHLVKGHDEYILRKSSNSIADWLAN